MYGLFNSAMRQMIEDRFGKDAWKDLSSKAKCPASFATMENYPDAMTYGLVETQARRQGVPIEMVLEDFGNYWVGYVKKAYADVFAMSGGTFLEFVRNLNGLHTRIAGQMPLLSPPSFTVFDESPGRFLLGYHTRREGLAPMLVGLLKGLGEAFGEDVRVVLLRGRADGLDHDVFEVFHRMAPAVGVAPENEGVGNEGV